MPDPVPPGRLLKIKDVVRETSLHRATIYRGIKAGTFPAPRRIGRQRVAWSEADLEAWKATCPIACPAQSQNPKPTHRGGTSGGIAISPNL